MESYGGTNLHVLPSSPEIFHHCRALGLKAHTATPQNLFFVSDLIPQVSLTPVTQHQILLQNYSTRSGIGKQSLTALLMSVHSQSAKEDTVTLFSSSSPCLPDFLLSVICRRFNCLS